MIHLLGPTCIRVVFYMVELGWSSIRAWSKKTPLLFPSTGFPEHRDGLPMAEFSYVYNMWWRASACLW
jgi:hypothetical protein